MNMRLGEDPNNNVLWWNHWCIIQHLEYLLLIATTSHTLDKLFVNRPDNVVGMSSYVCSFRNFLISITFIRRPTCFQLGPGRPWKRSYLSSVLVTIHARWGRTFSSWKVSNLIKRFVREICIPFRRFFFVWNRPVNWLGSIVNFPSATKCTHGPSRKHSREDQNVCLHASTWTHVKNGSLPVTAAVEITKTSAVSHVYHWLVDDVSVRPFPFNIDLSGLSVSLSVASWLACLIPMTITVAYFFKDGVELHPEEWVFDFEYATDIALLSHNAGIIQQALDCLAIEASQFDVFRTFKVLDNFSRPAGTCVYPHSFWWSVGDSQ